MDTRIILAQLQQVQRENDELRAALQATRQRADHEHRRAELATEAQRTAWALSAWPAKKNRED